jgi:DNA processing protein
MQVSKEEWIYRIALTKIAGIGPVQSRKLIEQFETATNIFNQKIKHLSAVENIGVQTAKAIKAFDDFISCEEEIKFIEKYKIQPLFISDDNFPKRLLNCYDAPVLLYFKGNADLNASRFVSIIGTRKNSEYGKWCTETITEKLAAYNVTIVSGLAFGIDAIAHKTSLQHNIPTIGVLAHGLNEIYPSEHKTLAKNMCEIGGLLTEFSKNISAERFNFPRRNRIVAGISEATIVIETGLKGGSMITAELANSYNRDVFALPGKINDTKSEGCNYLIRSNKAMLLDNVEEMAALLGWKTKSLSPFKQKQLFIELNEQEKRIVESLSKKQPQHIDEMIVSTGLSMSQFAGSMLNLELQNVVGSLPGKMYCLRG